MNALQFSPTLNRMLRQDAPSRLGEPTRPFLEAAVRKGRGGEAAQWLDYYLLEFAQIWYIFGVWDWYMVRYYLDRQGNVSWAQLLEASIAPWVGTTAGVKRRAISTCRGGWAKCAVGREWMQIQVLSDRRRQEV